jgi:hypothetical protein
MEYDLIVAALEKCIHK